MPSGWDDYYVVFLSAVLALLVPLILGLLSVIFSSKRTFKPRSADSAAALSASISKDTRHPMSHQRINTRFFLAANASLVLITLGLALIPCVGTLKSSTDGMGLLRGLIAIVTIAGFAALGLLYSARKGDLSWLRSYRKEGSS